MPTPLSFTFCKRALQAGTLAVAVCFSLGASDAGVRYDKLNHQMMCSCGCGQVLGECNHVGCPEQTQRRWKYSVTVCCRCKAIKPDMDCTDQAASCTDNHSMCFERNTGLRDLTIGLRDLTTGAVSLSVRPPGKNPFSSCRARLLPGCLAVVPLPSNSAQGCRSNAVQVSGMNECSTARRKPTAPTYRSPGGSRYSGLAR